LPKASEQKVKYEILAAVGPGRLFEEGGLADLLFDIPYLFLGKIIPPIGVVNEILRKGTVDAGMSGGCKWKPFRVDRTSYAKLVADLKKLGFRVVEPADWVTTHSDWYPWCAELVWGIPALESRQQWAEILELHAQREAAIRVGDAQLAASLLLQVTERCGNHSRFINEHRVVKPKLPLFRRPTSKWRRRQP